MTESTAHSWERSQRVSEPVSNIGKGRTDEDPPPSSTTGTEPSLVEPKVKGDGDDEENS